MYNVGTERDAYLDAFLQAARTAVTGDLAPFQGTLEDLDVATDSDHAYATATVRFRDRQYQYRRRIWPADHPARVRAGLFATVLVERLLTTRPTGIDPVIL
jgi:hypothetical protein